MIPNHSTMETQETQAQQYDVIVIGSGMGGMTAASLLAQLYGKKVLLLEKNWIMGGLSQEFSRKDTSWSVGLHYIGDMEEGSSSWQILDFIVGRKLSLKKLPKHFDELVFPSQRFSFTDLEASLEDLAQRFPPEKKALRRYRKDISRYEAYFRLSFVFSNFLPSFLRPLLKIGAFFLRIDPKMTVAAYLDKYFKDASLKAILAARWGDFGLLPSEGSMIMHAVIAHTYRNGAWYTKGGPQQIADGVKAVLESNDSEVKLNHEVKEIIIREQKAVGVVAEDKLHRKEVRFFADHIISNLGAQLTYDRLLAVEDFEDIRKDIASINDTNTFVSLYLELSHSPEKLGLSGSNLWIYGHEDQEKNLCSVNDDDFPTNLYVSFPTLRGHQSSKHTVEIMTTVSYCEFASACDKPWLRRGEVYEKLKEKITESILLKLESYYPGFKEMITHHELATPLTMEFFTGRKYGTSYGLKCSPRRYELRWLKAKSPVENLYLSGQDVACPGIVGAMMGGVAAAAQLAGGSLGFFNLMYRLKKANSRAVRSMDGQVQPVSMISSIKAARNSDSD